MKLANLLIAGLWTITAHCRGVIYEDAEDPNPEVMEELKARGYTTRRLPVIRTRTIRTGGTQYITSTRYVASTITVTETSPPDPGSTETITVTQDPVTVTQDPNQVTFTESDVSTVTITQDPMTTTISQDPSTVTLDPSTTTISQDPMTVTATQAASTVTVSASVMTTTQATSTVTASASTVTVSASAITITTGGSTSTVTNTAPVTITQGASTTTITASQAASTVTVSQSASTITVIAPTATTTQAPSTITISQSTATFTQAASTVVITASASTVTLPASTVTSTGSAATVTQTASTVTTTQAASTVTASASTVTQSASTITLPASTVTQGSTVSAAAFTIDASDTQFCSDFLGYMGPTTTVINTATSASVTSTFTTTLPSKTTTVTTVTFLSGSPNLERRELATPTGVTDPDAYRVVVVTSLKGTEVKNFATDVSATKAATTPAAHLLRRSGQIPQKYENYFSSQLSAGCSSIVTSQAPTAMQTTTGPPGTATVTSTVYAPDVLSYTTTQAIASTPTAINGGQDADDTAYQLNIPFPVYAFGASTTNLWVSANGLLTFDTGSTSYNSQQFPTNIVPDVTLGVFWSDDYIYSSAGNGLQAQITGPIGSRQLIIRYDLSYVNKASPTSHFEIDVLFYEANPNIIDYKFYAVTDYPDYRSPYAPIIGGQRYSTSKAMNYGSTPSARDQLTLNTLTLGFSGSRF